MAADASGKVTVTDTGTPAGVMQTYTYTAVVEDVAGNQSDAGPGLDVTIDPVAPLPPVAPDLQAASDTGTSNTDNLTAATDPAFTVTGVETGARVRLLRNGAVVKESAPAGAGGSVTVDDPTNPPPGKYVYTALQIDQAGNVGPESGQLVVTFDRSVASPSAPDLQAASDSGSSNSDDVTNVTNPTFDISGIELNPDAPSAAVTVRLLRNGTVVNSKPLVGGGTVSIQDLGPVVPTGSDVTVVYTAQQVDAAGNISAIGSPLSVRFDTRMPAAPTAPDLQAGSDSGISSIDNLTKVTTPTFDVSGVEANAIVRLFRRQVGSSAAPTLVAQVTSSAAGTVSLVDPGDDLNGDGTPDRVPDGIYDYTAQQIDLAGNVGSVGSNLTVTIDATAPAAPSNPDLRPTSDSGVSNSDNLTNVTTPVFDIGGLITGSTIIVRLLRDGVQVNQVQTVAASGSVTLTDPSATPDGSYTYTAVQVDAAGNVSPASMDPTTMAGLTVTIDTQAPDKAGRPDLQLGSDSGPSNFDNITSTRVLKFDVPGVAANVRVQLYRDGMAVGSLISSGASGGSVTVTDPGSVPDGTHLYTVKQIDNAGNVGLDSPALEVIVTPFPDPSADPSAPDLIGNEGPTLTPPAEVSDTGRSDSDNITRDTSPTFLIKLVGAADQTVELLRKVSGDPSSTYTVVGTVTGSGTITDTTAPGDGLYDYAARRGGVNGTISLPLAVQIDNTNPAKPGTPDLTSASDTGASNTDNITTDTAPTFTVSGIEPNAEVQLFRLDTITPGATPVLVADMVTVNGGVVTISEGKGPVPDGVYQYTVKQIDAADNASAVSDPLQVIFIANLKAPSVPDLVATSDTGSSDSDNVTKAVVGNPPQFLITGSSPGYTVRLLRRSAGSGAYSEVARGTADANGSVTLSDLSTAFTDGTFEYVADTTFTPLVTGPASAPLTVVIDNTPPATPSIPTLLLDDDSGVVGDETTNVVQPRLTGTINLAANETSGASLPMVQLVDASGNVLGTGQASADGTYTVKLDKPFPMDGIYTVQAQAIDQAGNLGAVGSTLSLTIDTVRPPAVSLALSPTDDTGIAGDQTTSVKRPHLVGSTGPGLTVQLIDVGGNLPGSSPGAVVTSATSQADGSFQLQLPSDAPDGSYTLLARAVTVAGNITQSSQLTLTIDSQPPGQLPTLRLDLGSDTGVKGDSTTGIRRPLLVGETAPGTTVEVVGPNGVVLSSATPDAQGNYSLKLASDLVNGSITLRPRSRDAAGNIGPLGAPLNLTITTTYGDFDADGKGDLALYQPGQADGQSLFLINRSTAGGQAISSAAFQSSDPTSPLFGFQLKPSDLPISGDFDGDGITDVGVYRPNSDRMPGAAEWIILGSRSGPRDILFGAGGGLDLPAPADFDGDGVADIAVFRPVSDLLPGAAEWFIMSSKTGTAYRVTFGAAGGLDLPAPADFDGDGKADIAVFRPSSDLVPGAAQWFFLPSGKNDGTYSQKLGGYTVLFGAAGVDLPVQADYNGDGLADIATYRPTTSEWFIMRSGLPAAESGLRVAFGAPGDRPAPADYTGDGIADLAVFRPTTAQWTIQSSQTGSDMLTTFGPSDSVPLLSPLGIRDPRANSVANPANTQSASQVAADSTRTATASQVAAPATSLDLGQQAKLFSTQGTSIFRGRPVQQAAARRGLGSVLSNLWTSRRGDA